MAEGILSKLVPWTLADRANLLQIDGNIAYTIKMLTESNPFMQVLPSRQATDIMMNQVFQLVKGPTTYVKYFNQGTLSSKPSFTSKTESIMIREARSNMEALQEKLSPNPELERNHIDQTFIESMSRDMAYDMIYQSVKVDPAHFDGLAARLNVIFNHGTNNNWNVQTCEGTGDYLTSVYIVAPRSNEYSKEVAFIYPKGAEGLGITREKLEKHTITDDEGRQAEYITTVFNAFYGLSVADPRCIGRVCNINATPEATSNIINTARLDYILKRMPTTSTKYLITSKAVADQLDMLAKDPDRGFRFTSYSDAFGKTVYDYKGHPLLISDAVLEREEQVV